MRREEEWGRKQMRHAKERRWEQMKREQMKTEQMRWDHLRHEEEMRQEQMMKQEEEKQNICFEIWLRLVQEFTDPYIYVLKVKNHFEITKKFELKPILYCVLQNRIR